MNHYTEIVAIIDKSGSMNSLINDTIGGYNSFIKNQQKIPGEARLTTVLFDTGYEVFQDNVHIDDAISLTHMTYVPSGGTALLDAMGRTIKTIIDRQTALPENDRTNRIIVMTITDGEENSSHNYTKEDIKNLITEQTAAGWKFDFMSADMNAINTAVQSYGVSSANTVAFAATSAGVRKMYAGANINTTAYRMSTEIRAQKDKQSDQD